MRQAEWNDITWGTSQRTAVFIKSLEISQELNTETQKSKSGQDKKTVKGVNPEELTVQYSAAFGIGTDPRGEFEMLKKCAGKQDDFLLNGRPISNEQFELDEVELSDTIIDDFGRIIKGDITMKFNTEHLPSNKGGKGSQKKKSGKGKTGKKGSLSLKKEILNS